MDSYEFALGLFNKACIEIGNAEQDTLVKRFCEDNELDKSSPSGILFAGFVMGLETYSEVVNKVMNSAPATIQK